VNFLQEDLGSIVECGFVFLCVPRLALVSPCLPVIRGDGFLEFGMEKQPNAYNTTDLLIDIDGYFAAPGTGGLSMYPTAPCRVLDTRNNNGQPSAARKL